MSLFRLASGNHGDGPRKTLFKATGANVGFVGLVAPADVSLKTVADIALKGGKVAAQAVGYMSKDELVAKLLG